MSKNKSTLQTISYIVVGIIPHLINLVLAIGVLAVSTYNIGISATMPLPIKTLIWLNSSLFILIAAGINHWYIGFNIHKNGKDTLEKIIA